MLVIRTSESMVIANCLFSDEKSCSQIVVYIYFIAFVQ